MGRKQTTNMEVKKNNRNRVFRYIRKNGIVSNPDIAYDTKMSLPTVTQITKELIEQGLIKEMGELHSTGGRRAKALSVAANVRQAVGLDITKNHIALVLTNLTGEILHYVRITQPFAHEEEYYQKVNAQLEHFLDDSGADRDSILGIGISFPGIVDLDKKVIAYSHILGIKFIPFDFISSYFNYPCFFLNDANAGAFAEGMGAKKSERFFYLSLSNSVGGSIFSEHELIQGSNFHCGEVGHMTIVPDGKKCYCGKNGCLDAYCSAAYLSDMTEGKLEAFFKKLEEGNQQAALIWEEYVNTLSVALNNIHMLLDSDIVIGGYVGSYIESLIPEIWKKVSKRNTFSEDKQFIRSCQFKMEAAAFGAALYVMEDFMKQI